MSVFDGLKGKAGALTKKATELVGENSGKIKDGIGHAGNFVDSKTGGKYADKIDKVQSKASEMVDKTDRGDTNRPPGSGIPPAA
ncbi:antitoxin [Arthrobacter sp. H20]|uniref:antitoxin n=1 Tax=Arthrobacter sp. H20 TaxID=1267981 RepID=UPI0004B24ED6|nr:antitoxin [Arthrobacter sp. H20]